MPSPTSARITGPQQAVARPEAPPLYRPVIDLESGVVLAVEAEAAAAPAPHDDSAAHAERLIRLARRVASDEALLPLILPVPAAAAAASPDVTGQLELVLRRTGRRPRDITVMLGPDLAELPRTAAVRAAAHVRDSGFRCAFATAAVPVDVILDQAPFLMRLPRNLVAGLPGDERSAAVVEGMARIARSAGVYPVAPGISSVDQLAALRDAGVRLGHGPLFADDDWTPGARVRPLPEIPPAQGGGQEGPPVSTFIGPPVALEQDATAAEVLDAFTNDPVLNSIILLDHRERPVALLDRSRFLLSVSGPYGHALHAARPARRLADPPKTVPLHTTAMEALRAAGASGERVHDDLVAVNAFGQAVGVVAVGDVIAALSRG
ncbi:EAL domain-containing protein [Nocardiopsis sp. RSe5-2]|uniref:EAL domain-containing protein n=1 Tax=Nocardiopsis endophytica TaxID=3018445 RepID=A0ABT4U7C0_9ACTN|nr:EAL domain-containing protein [Nocardiopsis endophytica]MDA2812846.1 EAL domain-containing protein [Nocardiopsis endophytica]